MVRVVYSLREKKKKMHMLCTRKISTIWVLFNPNPKFSHHKNGFIPQIIKIQIPFHSRGQKYSKTAKVHLKSYKVLVKETSKPSNFAKSTLGIGSKLSADLGWKIIRSLESPN